ncbi:Protein of unknown function [Modicisalibacter muralis]|uniref:DUF3047 domain-containing protein n=1 Tax=Modicisalibacter muralis TaxID=119000 RepID=A0A1G9EZB8_9GAMM|nr:DUF3047 domain-containing protein [Halomonas muralis]SDK81526.1 Protein of unknown function [Halomonas muralis]
MTSNSLRWPTAALLLAMSSFAMSEPITFTATQIAAWPTRSFEGETRYSLVTQTGQQVLQARAAGQASAKYLEREIDLAETPYLSWCWKVSGVYAGLDETTKAGDDYPARVYVVDKTGILPWQVEAVNYVWSSNRPVGNQWVNAFTDRAQLLALQSGDAYAGQWVAEVRDVRKDFAMLFGSQPDELTGVALMSDGDNAGGDATAWFSGLRFSSSSESPDCPGE